MPTLPLITHPYPDSIFAWREDAPVTAQHFLADAVALSHLLPAGKHMLNACNDRYHFAVGLAAAMLQQKISLLPSTQTPEMIRQLVQFAPDTFCLTDNANCSVALPKIFFSEAASHDEDEHTFNVPQIASEQLVATVFTSGSTGAPLPHHKTWGSLVRNVQAGAQLCGLNDGRTHAIIGTVPPQHMYGFESTILLVMQSANAMVAAKSFYPADICAAIASVPQPRALISTPVHMRTLVHANLDFPAVDLILSATAPLSLALAQTLEAQLHAPLLEIYGSTETGQIAARHPTRTIEWRLFDGVELTCKGDETWACGGHVEQPTLMNDVIEILDHQRFLLHGRTADLINIAGKRNSLAYLNLQLNAIPGVIDGAFFMPEETTLDEATRLMAFVVAPSLTSAQVNTALRERIDMVFLPRPLIFVDALPRNATGKLPHQVLQQFALAHRRQLADRTSK